MMKIVSGKRVILVLSVLLSYTQASSDLGSSLVLSPNIEDLSKNMVEIVITDLSGDKTANTNQKSCEANRVKEAGCDENATGNYKNPEPRVSQLQEITALPTKDGNPTDSTLRNDSPAKSAGDGSSYHDKRYERNDTQAKKYNKMGNLEAAMNDNKEDVKQRPPVDFKDVVQHKNYKHASRIDHKKCYIVWTNSVSISDLNKILDEFEKSSKFAKYVYKRHILGFTICTTNYQILDVIKGKYVLINIEEDKLYRIASVENDRRLLYNMKSKSVLNFKDFQEDFFYQNHRNDFYFKSNKNMDRGQQSPVPLHFFRISNLGNLFFNNYLLDNVVFRILKINSLIKYFYKYNYYFSGKGVKITVIDTPKCNEHRLVNSSLISGHGNSLAKSSSSFTIEAFSCSGTIKLSRLLDILENIEQTDILVLPFSGPHSEVLDFSLKKISQKSIIVAASGNDSDNSCNYSPNGHHIIKVGSVDKNGYISSFSNRGQCTNIYSLGEDILNSNGTSHSAAFAASSVAMFLEKYPQASYDKVLQFLLNNSIKNNYEFAILKIPILEPKELSNTYRKYYDWKEAVIFNGVTIIVTMVVILLLYRYYRRSRTASVDDEYLQASLR